MDRRGFEEVLWVWGILRGFRVCFLGCLPFSAWWCVGQAPSGKTRDKTCREGWRLGNGWMVCLRHSEDSLFLLFSRKRAQRDSNTVLLEMS